MRPDPELAEAAYTEAIRIVDEVRRNEDTWLQLRMGVLQHLTRLPSLSGLDHVRTIILHGSISDLEPIIDCGQLEVLNLNGNSIFDLRPLSEIRSLRHLDLSNNPVCDLSPISTITSLETLALTGTHVFDVSPIRSLINLQRLHITAVPTTEFTALATLTRLEKLNLAGNPYYGRLPDHIKSQYGKTIERHGRIYEVALANSEMKTTFLSRLVALEGLHLDNSPVCDLAPIAELVGLVRGSRSGRGMGLTFAGCPVQDPQLQRFAKMDNPQSTIETLNYLRAKRGLPDVESVIAEEDARMEAQSKLNVVQVSDHRWVTLEKSEIPKVEKSASNRGLVISAPMRIANESFSVRGELDPQELRFALLFWDELAWPTSNWVHVSIPEEEWLTAAHILTRPRIEIPLVGNTIDGSKIGEFAATAHLQGFLNLDTQEPGKWALAQGNRSFLDRRGALVKDRGVLVNLTRAVPIPTKDVPLEEVLEFKHRRKDEITRFNKKMDALYEEISASADTEFALKKRIAEIDETCASLLRVTKEWGKGTTLGDLKMSFEVKLDLKKAVLGALISETFGLPLVGAVWGLDGSLKLSRDVTISGLKKRDNPFWYVASIHKELGK